MCLSYPALPTTDDQLWGLEISRFLRTNPTSCSRLKHSASLSQLYARNFLDYCGQEKEDVYGVGAGLTIVQKYSM